MRISDRYIGSQVLLGTLYAVAILSLVLLLGNLFKEIRPLLVERGAPIGLVIRFALNVLPFSLMFTIPWGFLSAVLLVFGRLSTDQEITSFRVAGVSLVRLAAPVFVIGALLSCLSMWLNLNVVPTAKATISQLLYDQANRDPDSLLRPGLVESDLGDSKRMKLLIEGKSNDWVEGFNLYQLPRPQEKAPSLLNRLASSADTPMGEAADRDQSMTFVHAARASLMIDKPKNQLRIKLEDAYFESVKPDGSIEMAFAGNAEPLLIDLKRPRSERKRPGSMTGEAIEEHLKTDLSEKDNVKFRLEMTKRYSFSFACLAFAFVAVPLGINSRRKDTSAGLILSLALGAGYFMFTVLAEEFETRAGSTFAAWAPNIACIAIGLFLFRRARFK